MKKIAIFGCGGHSGSVTDIINRIDCYEVAGYVDRELSDYSYQEKLVIATDDNLHNLKNSGIYAGAIGIGSVRGGDNIRKKVIENALSEKIEFPVIADPSAVISETASVGDGTVIGKRAVINSDAFIGRFAIINTGAIVEHNVSVGDYSHISVGAVVCGDVSIGENCMIGAGATVIQGVKIGNNVTVGAGAVVIRDIMDGSVVTGNPARVKDSCDEK